MIIALEDDKVGDLGVYFIEKYTRWMDNGFKALEKCVKFLKTEIYDYPRAS